MVGFAKSKLAQSALGFLVSAALIIWIFKEANWAEVQNQLISMNYLMFLPITILTVFHYLIRSWRWKYLLPEGNQARTRQLFDSIMVGCFANFILPLRAGEFVRPFLLSRYCKESFSTTFVSVIVERFFDLSVVLLSFVLVLNHVEGIPNWVGKGAQALSVLAFCILVLMVAGTFFPELLVSWASRLMAWLPEKLRQRILRFIEDFLKGAAILNHGSRLLKVVLLSFAVWGSCYLLFHFYFGLFGAYPGLWPAVTVAVIVALAVAAPSAPGFIGVYQAGCVAGFALFGLNKEVAVAYSIVTHLYQYILFVLYGVYVLMRDNLHLADLKKEQ